MVWTQTTIQVVDLQPKIKLDTNWSRSTDQEAMNEMLSLELFNRAALELSGGKWFAQIYFSVC